MADTFWNRLLRVWGPLSHSRRTLWNRPILRNQRRLLLPSHRSEGTVGCLASRHDRDTFLRTDPSADPATSTPIQVKQMPSPVPLLNRISLLRKPQRVRSMEEMTNTSQVRDRDINRSLRFADNRSHYYLPVRLYRPVVYTPPGSRHVRQTVSKQNRRNSGHVPVGTGDI